MLLQNKKTGNQQEIPQTTFDKWPKELQQRFKILDAKDAVVEPEQTVVNSVESTTGKKKRKPTKK